MGNWSKTAPSASGCYWHRRGSHDFGVPIRLFSDHLDLRGLGAYTPDAKGFVTAKDFGGEWYSEAIPEPPTGREE